MNAERRRLQRKSGRFGDMPPDGSFRQPAIERERTAGERLLADIAQHQIGVGHRRGQIALPITGRPWDRTRAAWADPQRPAGIEGGDAAAAGTHFGNIYHRNP
jgi:hypothetical protein